MKKFFFADYCITGVGNFVLYVASVHKIIVYCKAANPTFLPTKWITLALKAWIQVLRCYYFITDCSKIKLVFYKDLVADFLI